MFFFPLSFYFLFKVESQKVQFCCLSFCQHCWLCGRSVWTNFIATVSGQNQSAHVYTQCEQPHHGQLIHLYGVSLKVADSGHAETLDHEVYYYITQSKLFIKNMGYKMFLLQYHYKIQMYENHLKFWLGLHMVIDWRSSGVLRFLTTLWYSERLELPFKILIIF